MILRLTDTHGLHGEGRTLTLVIPPGCHVIETPHFDLPKWRLAPGDDLEIKVATGFTCLRLVVSKPPKRGGIWGWLNRPFGVSAADVAALERRAR